MRLEPAGELTALPQTPSWIRGMEGREKEEKGNERRGMTRGRKRIL